MKELTIYLNSELKTPLYEQLYTYVKEQVQRGDIKANEKLPSSRSLAAHLRVSRSTVDLAYEQLLSEGYIESIPCKGYYVCQMEGLHRFETEKVQLPTYETDKELEYDFDFTPSGIDLDGFPFSNWRKITKNILLDDKKELFQLGEPKGEKSLRETISSYLYQARGVRCKADQIIIGAGSDYLLLLLAELLGRDKKIAMENPTYVHAYHMFKQMGYEVNTIEIDEYGMKANLLEESESDLAYIMPSHQYPLGTVMPIKRRLELLKWAEKCEGRYLIEDDYDSEFRYKGKPIPALQGSDHSGKVIYFGTFSRSIAPAIRIGYMVLPNALLEMYEKKLKTFSSTVSRIDQMILEAFIKEGYYERHLNKMRTIYGRKHDLLLWSLKELEGICKISGEYAGVHVLLTFTNDLTEEEAVKRAKEVGVRVYPLSESYITEQGEKKERNTIVLGYGTLGEEEILEAVKRLKSVWKEEK